MPDPLLRMVTLTTYRNLHKFARPKLQGCYTFGTARTEDATKILGNVTGEGDSTLAARGNLCLSYTRRFRNAG